MQRRLQRIADFDRNDGDVFSSSAMLIRQADSALDVGKAAGPASDIARKLLSDGDIRGIEHDVEISVMLFKSSDDRRSSGWMQLGGTEIRRAARILEDCVSQPFVVALANGRQPFAIGPHERFCP